MSSTRHAQDARYAARTPAGSRILVITSGKGGVGKTNLALNLGILLSRRRRRVVLMDADYGLANADILINVTPRGTVLDLLNPERIPQEILVDGPDGLRVLCGFSGTARGPTAWSLSADDSRNAVRRLACTCDDLIVDCGAGLSENIFALALMADLVILVTTPEPTAMADAYAVLKLLCNRGFIGNAGVVVNFASSREEGAEAARRLQHVADRFLGLPLDALGSICWDRHVPRAVRERKPVCVAFPGCQATLCMEGICDRLIPDRIDRAVRGSIWARMAGLFL